MKRLADEPMLIALPSHHPLAVHPKLPISALANEAFVLFPRIVGLSLYDDVVEACRNAGFEMIVAQEAPQMPSVVNPSLPILAFRLFPLPLPRSSWPVSHTGLLKESRFWLGWGWFR